MQATGQLLDPPIDEGPALLTPDASEAEQHDLIAKIQNIIKPTGWKVVVVMAKYPEKTAGGVFLPQESREKEQLAQVVGLVCAMGPLAFTGERFCGVRSFEVGDWVTMRPYQGDRLNITGFDEEQEIRLINDDVPSGVVSDPALLRRR